MMAALIVGFFTREESAESTQASYARRTAIRAEVDAAQDAAIKGKLTSENKIEQVAALLASKPAPGAMPLPSAAPVEPPKKEDSAEAETPSDPPVAEVTDDPKADEATLALGKELYDKAGSCTTCHQPTGLGIPGAFPPLADSEWVSGPSENLIRIQLRGLMGPITVNGTLYNGVMPPLAEAVFPQTDENIAAVLTYVRHTFGNEASVITPEMVANFKDERGKPMLTVPDLIDPLKDQQEAPEADTPPTE